MTAFIRAFDAKVTDDFDAKSFARSNKTYFTMQIVDPLPVILSRR